MSKRTRTPAQPINVPVGDWRAIPGHIKKTIDGVNYVLSHGQYVRVAFVYRR